MLLRRLEREVNYWHAELAQCKALMQPGQIDAVMQGIRDRDEQLARAQARCAEVEKDAARYRWLRSRANTWTVKQFIGNHWRTLMTDQLDAAIDEAMKNA